MFIISNTVLNILINYIPHETKIYGDRDPPWMNAKIKELISQKNKLYYRIKKANISFLDKQLLHSLQQHLSKSIENAKNKYFFRISEKLNNPNTSTKCYWALIKTLLKGKKVPCVLQFLIIIDMSEILKRNVNFSILTFQINALY